VLSRELLDAIDWLVESTTHWYLAAPNDLPTPEELEDSREAFVGLENWLANSKLDVLSSQRDDQVEQLVAKGVPRRLATRHVFHDELVRGPNIIELSLATGRSIEEVAELFMRIGDRYRLDWLKRQTEKLGTKTRWNRWAIRSLEGDLVRLRRDIAEGVLLEGQGLDPAQALDGYAAARRERHNRLDQFMQLLAQEGSDDLDPLLVAARQIRALAS
jgi:glutamate dehydrogenase